MLWIDKLEKETKPDPWKDEETLHLASIKVFEAQNELLDVQDAAGLASLSTDEDLKSAYRKLAYLGGRIKKWVPPWKRWEEEELQISEVQDIT